jgi:hypothetical protein
VTNKRRIEEPMADRVLRLAGLQRTADGNTYEFLHAGPPACPHCGAEVSVSFVVEPGRLPRVQVGHPTPLCAEFAKAVEGGTR